MTELIHYEIHTKRLSLRSLNLNDVNELFQLMSDERLTQYLTWTAHTSADTTLGLIQNLIDSQANDRGYHWCIVSDNQIIGLVSLIDVKRTIRTWTLNRAELSYWISPIFQGKGFATEASESIIKFGFQNLNLHKIIVAHATENIESFRICQKLGFKQYAHEHDAFQKNNKWHDLIWHELIQQTK